MEFDYNVVALVLVILVLLYLVYSNSVGKVNPNQSSNDMFTVTIESMWGNPSYPLNYPTKEKPHTGNMLLVTHNQYFHELFQPGTYASMGIKDSAEFGTVDTLMHEIMANNNSHDIGDITTALVLTTPGSYTFNVHTNMQYPYISFTTMVAPSSNWFMGANFINLYDMGKYNEMGVRYVDMYAYNAGTDNGNEFEVFPKHPRMPPVPIALLTSKTLIQNNIVPVARLKIQMM